MDAKRPFVGIGEKRLRFLQTEAGVCKTLKGRFPSDTLISERAPRRVPFLELGSVLVNGVLSTKFLSFNDSLYLSSVLRRQAKGRRFLANVPRSILANEKRCVGSISPDRQHERCRRLSTGSTTLRAGFRPNPASVHDETIYTTNACAERLGRG